MAKKVFKAYHQGQTMLFPPSLEDMIDKRHPVRIVNSILDKIDLSLIEQRFKGGRTSSYHPRMLLKVLVYAYLNNIYSGRKIEAALGENIHFMWISGMSKPDRNTINRFRSMRLQGMLKPVFAQVVMLLVDHGLVSLKEAYLDGTKIEANANKYTFVWGKALKSSKERIKRQMDELWEYAQSVAAEELQDTEPLTFEQIDPEHIRQTVEKIDNAIKGKDVDKTVRQKLNYAKKNWPKNLDKYADQEKILGKRNSFSKTDPDATFMRMKEDPMRNGQLKPGFNLQLSTRDQFILNYTLHQNPTDTLTLPSHLESFRQNYGELPQTLTADAGYGSEENYHYLAENNIEAYVKYAYFHLEQRDKYHNDPFRQDNLYYDTLQDCFYCPMGQKMERIQEKERETESGYVQHTTLYQAEHCEGCSLRGLCFKGKGNRTIEVNHNLRRYKQQARQNLLSELGIQHRKKRPADVEAVFGALKHNKNFRRYGLRGLAKVEVETGLLAIAHNLAKMTN